MDPVTEWLETDGRGGFASGTTTLLRTRRYHALLMHAASPSRRHVLVNGFDAFVRTPRGEFPLSTQRYQPGVTAPDGAAGLEGFATAPWPTWKFRLPDGTGVRQEIMVPHGRSAVVVRFTVDGDLAGCSLVVRPFFSGRDPHALQRENAAFRFEPVRIGDGLLWSPYDGVPPVALRTDGTYRHEPTWYRQFLYEEERARGLDDTEDLAAPGRVEFDLAGGEAVLVFASPASADEQESFFREPARALAARLCAQERDRRDAFPSPLHRAADAYLVRRGEGSTIIAGYPWFTDWGRDTFIALRGLCLATGRREVARQILLEWAGVVSQGMLPNFFPEGAAPPEYNSVDASLWYVVAVHDYLAGAGRARGAADKAERSRLGAAVLAILQGYHDGTRFGIRADSDGLLRCGEPGVQLTWMDARVAGREVTPRAGKPVEIQALWINALRIGAAFDPRWKALADRAEASFVRRFWNDASGGLYDVVDADGVADRVDPTVRPNQIFAVGGLPFAVLSGERAQAVVAQVAQRLLTPIGLRSLDPAHPDYRGRYHGGVNERDGAYHQGTVWPWLMGAFVDAWVRVRGATGPVRAEARRLFLEPLRRSLDVAGLGHLPEIADGDAPHRAHGCPFQAWSLGEFLRLDLQVLATAAPAPASSPMRHATRAVALASSFAAVPLILRAAPPANPPADVVSALSVAPRAELSVPEYYRL